MSKKIIELRNVQKSVQLNKKIDILKNINLCVDRGEFISIMGPSGSGKSTLLNIMCGLDTEFTGDVQVAGNSLKQLTEDQLADFRNKELGIVFQEYNLIPSLNSEENISLPLYFSSKKIVKKDVDPLIKLVGLQEQVGQSVKTLSGGEQQRIAIARALINRPQILLADEPTGALDSNNGNNIMQIFKSLNEKQSLTIVMVTHDKNIASYSGRTLELVDGAIVKEYFRGS